MKCSPARSGLLLEASGEIRFWQRYRLRRHLACCPACRQWQADAGRLMAIELPARPVPALNPAGMIPPRRLPVFAFAGFPALAAAVVLALAGMGGWGWAWWAGRQADQQALARTDRLREWTLLTAVMTGEDSADIVSEEPANPEAARRALARQLLRLQEDEMDELAAEENLTPSAQHPPTGLPRHNIYASPSEKYG